MSDQIAAFYAQLVDRGNPEQHHGALHLSGQQLQDVGDACLACGSQPVQIRSADGTGVGSERNGFDSVGSAADATVE